MFRGALAVVVTVVAAAAVCGAASGLRSAAAAGEAAPAGFTEARGLEAAASYVANSPVKVLCATSERAWGRYLAKVGETADTLGVATPPTARLNSLVCEAIDRFSGLWPLSAVERFAYAGSLETLVHEAVHLRGEADEGVTDCAAMHALPNVFVRFFHVSRGAQLQALMRSAWADHRQTAAMYRTRC